MGGLRKSHPLFITKKIVENLVYIINYFIFAAQIKYNSIMKKKIFIFIAVVLLAGVGIIGYGIMNDERITAARSVTRIDDGLYTMTYKGDYGFDEYIAQGGAATDAEMAQYIASFLMRGFGTASAPDTTMEYGCSSFVVRNERGAILGRNFDYDFKDKCKVMIVKAYPTNGYASISTACLNFMGVPADWQPDADMQTRMSALAAVYLPLDGINEKGLYVADLVSGDEEETHQSTDKPDLTITAAIRLLLDKAATVEEAVELLASHDMNSSIGTSHHFAIADASGASVVVEYIGGEMFVTPTDVVTNHYLTAGEKEGIGNELSHQRYASIANACNMRPNMSIESAMKVLKEASYPQYTQWSVVFATDACEARYVWKCNFDAQQHTFMIHN